MIPKPVMRVLEKCFAAEIEGMPAQFARGPHCVINGLKVSSAVMRANNAGLITQIDRKLSGWPPVIVRGIGLTEKGRLAYCEWADAIPDDGQVLRGCRDDAQVKP